MISVIVTDRQFRYLLTTVLFVVMLMLFPSAARAADERLNLLVHGVDGEMRSNVELLLALPEGIVKEGFVNRFWLKRFIKKAPSLVRQALEPLGYYQAKTAVAMKQEEDGRFEVSVTITPGAPVRVETILVELAGDGAHDPALRQQPGQFPLRQGQVLRHDLYELGKAQLKNRAVDLGYINAEYATHIVRVDPQANRAEVQLVLETGPKYFFGAFAFLSPPDYPERFLRRFITADSGDVFTYAAVGRIQSNFINSDRFERVVITPDLDHPDPSRIPVEISLKGKPRRTLRPGVGYGTDTGARFSLLYQDINAWRRGHQFKTDMVVAEIRQTFDMSYTFPSYRNIRSFTRVKTGFEREETDAYESRKLFAEIERVHSRDKRNVLSVYARLQREDYEVADSDETSRLLIPGVRWSYRTYESVTRPLNGYHLGLELRGAREGVVSDTSLLQTIGEANTLIRLPARWSLFLRGRGATTLQDNDFEEIPVSLRFFAGGDQSVRGYSYQSLGPADATGAVVGGKHLLVGSIELERQLTENWSAAVFYDVGNAFNDLSDYELARAAGLGLRWYTLIGPVRIDVARQLNQPDPSYRLHFSMGFTW